MQEKINNVAVPTTLFLDGLDTYVRRWLKARPEYHQQTLTLTQPGGESELQRATLDVAEALMLADGVALKITGENVVLGFLAKMFGPHAAAELIRRGAIEFVGQAKDAGTLVDPSSVKLADGSSQPPGNPILAMIDYGGFEPHVFCDGRIDGEAAAILALRRYQNEIGLADRELRELSRRTAKHTHAIPAERISEVAARVGNAYASGALAPLGLSPAIAREQNEYQDAAYAKLVRNIAHTETLLDLELDQYQMPELWADIRQFTSEMTSGSKALRSLDSILDLRGIPDLRSLFRDRVLRIEDVPALRTHPATVAFRRWLWSKPDPRDTVSVAREFVAELSGRASGKMQSYLLRGAQIASITILQDAAFEALQISAPARPMADVGVALLSDFALERFKRRPPSAFIDEVIQPAVYNSVQDSKKGRAQR